MPEMEHRSGTGLLLANHHTYLGHVTYALTIIQEPHGDLAIAGEFAFVAAPQDLTDYAQLSLELADDRWIGFILNNQDLTQNIYTFAGTGLYRERGA